MSQFLELQVLVNWPWPSWPDWVLARMAQLGTVWWNRRVSDLSLPNLPKPVAYIYCFTLMHASIFIRREAIQCSKISFIRSRKISWSASTCDTDFQGDCLGLNCLKLPCIFPIYIKNSDHTPVLLLLIYSTDIFPLAEAHQFKLHRSFYGRVIFKVKNFNY